MRNMLSEGAVMGQPCVDKEEALGARGSVRPVRNVELSALPHHVTTEGTSVRHQGEDYPYPRREVSVHAVC